MSSDASNNRNGQCPTRSQLRAFGSETLADGEMDTVAKHVVSCSHCATIVRSIKSESALGAADLRGEDPFAKYEKESAYSRLIEGLRTRRWVTDESRCDDMPQVVGFEVLEIIGVGGMGIVCQARQLSLNRIVALKTLLPRQASPQLLQRFEIEVRALARLKHPNVIHIYDVGKSGDRPFFTMELAEGGNLAQRMAQHEVSPEAAARLVEKLARAVQYLHSNGVLHRDLKPSNVLFTDEETVKVGDFGLAKIYDLDESNLRDVTKDDAVLGTPEYMAPEQARGAIDEIGPETDVYALGAILYQLLTGAPPFRGRNNAETLRLVQEAKVMRPVCRADREECRAGLEEICLKCLRRAATQRYRSAEELADDLQRWLEGAVPEARRQSQANSRRRLLKVTSAAIVTGLGAGYASSVLFDNETTEKRGVTIEEIFSDSNWRLGDLRGGVEVSSDMISLLGLGESSNGPPMIQADIDADFFGDTWRSKGRIGLFFAYQVYDDDGTSRVKYQSVDLCKLGPQFVLRHGRWSGRANRPASGSSLGWATINLASASKRTLTIESDDQNRTVISWNNQSLNWNDQRFPDWQAGRFGLHNYHAPGNFHNITINSNILQFENWK